MIVLDTHAWIWWVSQPSRLGRQARERLAKARRIGVPAICCLEVGVLVSKRRIEIDRPVLHWLTDALADPVMELLPLMPAVAATAASLPADLPGDPADRLIIATAMLESAELVTKDERMRSFSGVRTVW